jgi:transposase-like protein
MTVGERENLWAARIAEYEASGQSVPAWCEANNVSTQQLRYWLKKKKRVSETTPSESTSWLPLDLSNAGYQSSLLVRVGQVAIEVKPGFDPKLLLDVVKVLRAQ